MGMHVDYQACDNCYSTEWSYGEICVGCGCCEENKKSYRDMYKSRINHDKEMIEREKNFTDFYEPLRKLQEKNIRLNITHYKRNIRLWRKILRTMRRGNSR